MTRGPSQFCRLLFLGLSLGGFGLPAAAGSMELGRVHDIDRQADRLVTYLEEAGDPDSGEIAALASALYELADVRGPDVWRPDVRRRGKVSPGNEAGADAATAETAAGDGEFNLVPIDLVLSQVSLQTGSNHHIELKQAQADTARNVLLLRSGEWTLQSLARQLAQEDRPDVLVAGANGYMARLPLVVWQGAGLSLAAGEVLHLDAGTGSFILNSGTLRLEGATISGGGGANAVEEFRPFVLTALGGRTVIENSRLTDLGFGERPFMRGVSFVSSPFFPRRTQFSIRNSRFDRVSSIEFSAVDGGLFDANLVTNAGSSGLRIDASRNTVVTDNVIAGSADHGIALAAGAGKIRIGGNLLAANQKSGLVASGGVVTSDISDNLIVGNAKSGVFLNSVGCIDLSRNLLLRNGVWGIAAKRSFRVAFEDNVLISNRGPGLSIESSVFPDDTSRISGNRFIANISGVSADGFARLRFARNDFSTQRPILFSGALRAVTANYLTWAEGSQAGKAPDFVAKPSKLDRAADDGELRLADFSVAGLADCKS
jgi:poly(beta-D-mannuronate) C5 epimerase